VHVDLRLSRHRSIRYKRPHRQDIWGDADMTAGQKTMLSQRGVSTTYKRWGV